MSQCKVYLDKFVNCVNRIDSNNQYTNTFADSILKLSNKSLPIFANTTSDNNLADVIKMLEEFGKIVCNELEVSIFCIIT